MDWRITVFERRKAGNLEWTTIGLGPLDRQQRGASTTKVQQRMVDALRHEFAKLWPGQLEPLEFVPGRRLEKVTVEVSIEHGRRRVRGEIPLVLEPRGRGPADDDLDTPLVVAFHPLRPDEWFVHDPSRLLADEANAWFRDRWEELGGDEFENLRVQPKDGLRLVAFGIRPKSLLDRLERDKPSGFAALGGSAGPRDTSLLAQLGSDLTERAADGRAHPGAPRSPWREQLQQLVCGPRKRSVLLVGPSGAGKSALLRRLVHDLLDADGYASHRNLDRVHSVWQIRGNRIIAGMSYLGQWEQRCVDILHVCREKRALLWVEDVHAWGRIGESREADRSLATFFRGPVARGDLVILAECSAEQYQMLQDDDAGFAAAFTTLWVEPTGPAETLQLVLHEARTLELQHDVAFDARTFRAIADLGGALGTGTSDPGKSIDLVRALATDEAESIGDMRSVVAEIARGNKIAAIKRYREITRMGLLESKLAVEGFMAKGTWPATPNRVPRMQVAVRSLLDHEFDRDVSDPGLGAASVVRLLARRTGVPEQLLVPDRPITAAQITGAFTSQIAGQVDGISTVTDLVARLRTHLVDNGRPYGVLLLSGPTGTGKTELAKCLAEYLYGDPRRLVRLDMSEYAGPDAPARLIGDRARPEGVLTSNVRTQPFCVVLLDEIDKADPAVLALMLQLFDDGRLTDAGGHVVDFTHAVVLLTSNLGAARGASMGFGDSPLADRRAIDAAVREFFPPELFNRIDRVVAFSPLSAAAARRIAERELSRLLERSGLLERSVFVRFTPAVVDLVVQRGFAQKDGARSLKRWLEDNVGAWLADEIAGSKAAEVRVYWLFARDGEVRLHGEHLREAPIAPELPGEASAVARLLQEGGRGLRTRIPDALARVDAMLGGDSLARLATTLRESVPHSVAGDGTAGELAYNLEALRGELFELRDALRVQRDYDPTLVDADEEARIDLEAELTEVTEFSHDHITLAERGGHGTEPRYRAVRRDAIVPELPLRSRGEILRRLADVFVLEHALARAEDPEQHAILVELSRVSRGRTRARFDRLAPGLLEWLAVAYAGMRGICEGFVAVEEDGTVIARAPALLHGVVDHALQSVVLRIVGPGVRSYFSGEHGCHVRHALSGASEVVRVRIGEGRRTTPGDWVAAERARRTAFVDALERGPADAPLPPNPDEIPPIIRAYHYEPLREGVAAPLEIEDFPLAHVVRGHAKRLSDMLPDLFTLRLGALLGREEAP
jgi:ATP-dependent Clp protease ATP-binding subunit ClpA/ATP-dependent Clp protease ATP-binding subunit ClpC